MIARRVVVGAWLWIALVVSGGSFLSAADLKPSWHCLPEETVVVARMPQPKEFYDAIRARTKLGAVVLKQDRLDKAMELLREQAKDSFAELEKGLGDFNLKLEDWQALFSGELGLAVVVHPRQEKLAPVAMALAWIEPGEELANRLIAAIEKGIADQTDMKFPTKRIDLELAGHKVLYLVEPQTEVDDPDAFEDLPENFGKMTPEQRREWQEKQRQKLENAKRTQTGQQNIFVTRIGERMLVGMTVGGSPTFVDFDPAGDKAIDQNFDLASGAEEAKGVFARFLESHTSDAPATTLALLETPGLRQSLPDGLPFIEVLGDPRPLWRAKIDGAGEVVSKLKAYGVDGLGPVAYRQTLDGNVMRTGVFVSIPSPRRGVMTLLDQEAGPADVPAWVSREPIEYQHINFDLGKAYTTIRQLVLQEEGDKAKAGFDTAEGQVNQFLQTDIASLLSSLGSRHSAMTFLPKLEGAKNKKAGPVDPHFGGMDTQRMALVWQLKDEAIWQKILQMATPFAGGNLAEEQGFKGIRAPQVPGVGVFLGKGFLVLGMGEGVLESTLTALRNPPEGNATFGSSDVAKRANELLAPEPGMMYSVIDGGRYGKLLGQLRSVLTGAQVQGVPDAQTELLKGLEALMPTDQELEGIMGAGAGAMQINAHGIVIRSVSDLPAP
jgi:hypothetical protein